MDRCLLGRDVRGLPSRSPAGCGGGSGPPGCALGPVAVPRRPPRGYLPGLWGTAEPGSGRSRGLKQRWSRHYPRYHPRWYLPGGGGVGGGWVEGERKKKKKNKGRGGRKKK